MKEIERKFLLKGTQFTEILSTGEYPLIFLGIFRQGYVVVKETVTLRVRICILKHWRQAFLTAKGIIGDNTIERTEQEIKIEPELADKLLEDIDVITKSRYIYNDYVIDVFHGELDGLIVAEKEYDTLEEAHADTPPAWSYSEVTNNPQFLNHNLLGKKYINGIIA